MNFSAKSVVLLCLLLFFAASVCPAQEAVKAPEVKKVSILGNKSISENVIINKIKVHPGLIFDQKTINEDIERLYSLGFFENITVDVDEDGEGVNVYFIVKEKPILKEIIFKGNEHIKDRLLLKQMESAIGEIASERKLKNDVQSIKKFYETKAFPDAEIDYKLVEDKEAGQAIVTIEVRENDKIRIKKINIIGNKNVKAKELLKRMKTKNYFLFIRRGLYQEEMLKYDLDRMVMYYNSLGYIDMEVLDVRKIMDKTGKWMTVDIEVREGRTYDTGNVEISGCNVFPVDSIERVLKMKPGILFTPTDTRDDADRIKNYYAQRGYVDANVNQDTKYNVDTDKIDVTYFLDEGRQFRIEQIRVEGNTKTKDIVVRRELNVYPGEIIDGVKVKTSKARLENTGYFKDVTTVYEPGSKLDTKDLVVNVEEKKTGTVGFGAGFSSTDDVVGFVELTQSNFDWKSWPTFTGAGQKLRIKAQAGNKRYDLLLSWTEPWFLGKKLSFGFDLFANEYKYLSTDYEQADRGFDVRLAKPLGEFVRVDTMYKYEQIKIKNIDQSAPDIIRAQEGTHDVSSIAGGITRDTRDNFYNPSSGMKNTVVVTYAGDFLGGNVDFVKYFAQTSVYFPLIDYDSGIVLRLAGEAGVVEEHSGSDDVPFFERFFVGGSGTIRGFNYRECGPKSNDDINKGEPVGGKTMAWGSAEVTFPLYERIVFGACFIDIGNVWSDAWSFSKGGPDPYNVAYNMGAGIGVKLNLPIGPIRIDYGWPIKYDDFNYEKNGVLHFNMGYTF
ncbi:MAG: outer membrane protein assembly factor BamA [Candidatus Aureabacteria bacterium]|nr:outer membrane protein assembly factor BamA [Candidatus Auribacterota bacterium]